MANETIRLALPGDDMELLEKQAASLMMSLESYAEMLLSEGVRERRKARGNVVPIGRRKGDHE